MTTNVSQNEGMAGEHVATITPTKFEMVNVIFNPQKEGTLVTGIITAMQCEECSEVILLLLIELISCFFIYLVTSTQQGVYNGLYPLATFV